jgi:hypothetical protein
MLTRVLLLCRVGAQVGQALQQHHDGSMAQLVKQAGGSAARLVDLVAQSFPGFRDCAMYRC